MQVEYNQILLTTKDGRQVSIIQHNMFGQIKGRTCEVWIEGQEDPVGHLNAEKLCKYLQENIV